MLDQPPFPETAKDDPLPTIVINHMLEPPSRVTGITRFLFAMLQGLVDNCTNKIVLVTAWPENELPSFLTSSRVHVVSVPFYPQLSLNVAMQGRVLPRLMREHAPAVEFNSNPVGAFLGDWPRIITVHDLYLKLMPNDYPLRHRLTWNFLFPLSARKAGAIIVPSQSTLDDLTTFHRASVPKCVIVAEAPAFDMTSPVTPPPVDGRYGLIVGNLSPNKNAAVVVEALAQLEREGLAVPIVHIGRDEHGILEAAQRKFTLTKPIVTIPGVSDGALRGAYLNAAFFLNTSLHEGFCLPVVEAQVCGTPVIASNRSALPEVAGDGALLVDPTSFEAVASAIRRVWTDPAFASELSRRGTQNVARYSWNRAAAQLALLCSTVSARHRSPKVSGLAGLGQKIGSQK